MARYFRPIPLSQRNDPTEPHLRHANSNCTMACAANAVRYATLGLKRPRAGDMRHRQSDQDGPTGLDDAKQAANTYGVTLTLSAGWAAIKARRAEGRCLILQGDSGDLAGSCSEGQDVLHAVFLHPDDPPPDKSGYWLISDPWCNVAGTNTGKWRWLDRDDVYDYAKKLDFRFAYTRRQPRIA